MDPTHQFKKPVKLQEGKRSLFRFPYDILPDICDVLNQGALKHDDHNWRQGCGYTELLDPALRHLLAWACGDSTDRESGKSHLLHAICCLLFLAVYEKTGTGVDDRFSCVKFYNDSWTGIDR